MSNSQAESREVRKNRDQLLPVIMVVNGPNLGRLGVREPDIYGSLTMKDLKSLCQRWGRDNGFQVEVVQSDDETDLVHWMHQAVDKNIPVVLNPAAFTHYSYALSDAAVQVTRAGLPLVEVHISNPAAREFFRKNSLISPVATGTITGQGLYGYILALEAIHHILS